MKTQIEKQEIPRFLSVCELAKYYPVFNESAIRNLLFKRKENGLYKCVRRIGTRIVINTEEFEKWLETTKEKI